MLSPRESESLVSMTMEQEGSELVVSIIRFGFLLNLVEFVLFSSMQIELQYHKTVQQYFALFLLMFPRMGT